MELSCKNVHAQTSFAVSDISKEPNPALWTSICTYAMNQWSVEFNANSLF